MTNSTKFKVYYTDGSTRGNGQAGAVGAYGWVQVEDSKIIERFAMLDDSETTPTNQRMELLGALSAIEHCHINYGDVGIVIYTDSAYLCNCFHQKWYQKWKKNGWVNSKKEAVANRDLWEKLVPYFEREGVFVDKVPGHSDCELNNIIDSMVQTLTAQAKKGE